MPYLDPTEQAQPPPTPPKLCPMCGGKLVTKWRGDHSIGRRPASTRSIA